MGIERWSMGAAVVVGGGRVVVVVGCVGGRVGLSVTGSGPPAALQATNNALIWLR